jgi:phage terminase small subunit
VNRSDLTDRQRLFVEEYLTCWNASEAARRSGYKTQANVQGARLIANDNIRRAIELRVAAKIMVADEVLARLSDHATASLGDFIDKYGQIDIRRARQLGKLHLVKRYKTTSYVRKNGQKIVTAEIELHDPQTALVQVGRHYGLFSDKLVIEDWREEARKAGFDPDEVQSEFEGVIASKMATSHDGGGDSESSSEKAESDSGMAEGMAQP